MQHIRGLLVRSPLDPCFVFIYMFRQHVAIIKYIRLFTYIVTVYSIYCGMQNCKSESLFLETAWESYLINFKIILKWFINDTLHFLLFLSFLIYVNVIVAQMCMFLI
jgi:hypothetical protein